MIENRISPLIQVISFDKLLKQYDAMADSSDTFQAAKAKFVLEAQAPYPILREGFKDYSLLKKYENVIKIILSDSFSEVLTTNEIKTASIPFDNVVFNSSKRFKKILKDAGGEEFIPVMRNFSDHQLYVMSCTVILSSYYGFQLDVRPPFFYDIIDEHGVMRHYRILYNADFIEILPTENAKDLSQDDIDELLENFDDLELWKEKIPVDSFICKGFVISSMFDVTSENAISEIKSSLIGNDKRGNDSFMTNLQEAFRSFFSVSDVKAGFVTYNSKKNQFEKVVGLGIESFILQHNQIKSCTEALCQNSYSKLLKDNTSFTISDVDKYVTLSDNSLPYKGLKEQNIKSAIFAPIADKGKLLGVLELVSYKKNALNSVNANKLVDIMPFIVSGVLRSMNEEENRIDAVIQNECTSVHSSVYWKFKEEAKRFITDGVENRASSFKEIVFKDVYPLYGQVDIKDSSIARNKAIQRDLMIHLSAINKVLSLAWEKNKLPVFEELMFRVNNHIDEVKEVLNTNSEQAIFNFVQDEITPVFEYLKKGDIDLEKAIISYESDIDMGTLSYYDHRRNYDESVMQINKKLSSVIDKKQLEAQEMFPHFFERYKTDGVEHNIYVGASIVDDKEFNPLYLSNLRLWQLQVMCEMENEHYLLKPLIPVPLDVASLMLVYSSSLAIRFRMDEKRFDVDGTYNARYEIIKKRIDKAYIKGTTKRITEPGKMVIVYSQKNDELEYLRYIKFLKSKEFFTGKIEIVELEGLQGVSGLKAIRADIRYKSENSPGAKTFTYEELIEEFNIKA
ncbi:GAF domain-containing protein [Cellulophaga sp. HaHaR_3_176]|uniref:GAF domain-containing protein n=1 Tax=Cellulophaga sp. HaHaR_3_176 TaxID=1942464 RepID=UPI001C1F9E16|nr:GAF domain-containing protein [Cellulophaga sp. HaHaR_3_176]QWX83216.1 GAF domain-containing protein [Cellulophaga sp. HaHaR_3_176]